MRIQEKIGRQITVAEMAPHVHSFLPGENKVNKIADWLTNWIKAKLASGEVKPYDMLPSKGDLAFHIGVSQGTIQNVFRYVEDCGLVESKQKIGTFIKPESNAAVKLTSKREFAVEEIKKYIKNNNLNTGDYLISTRKLAQITGISNATIRMAFASLVIEGILKKVNNSFVIEKVDYDILPIRVQTITEKTASALRTFIKDNYHKGDKLPCNTELASMFKVSVKTLHDAIKLLTKEGLLYPKRGQYGTIVINSDENNDLYNYEHAELQLRSYIAQNCEIGSKLPSMQKLAKLYSVSAKTIKKALDNLADDGYVTFTRGRYGGTFVTDIPQGVNEAYKWLALSSDFVSNT